MSKYLSVLLILVILISITAMRSDVAAPQDVLFSNLKVLPADISKKDLDSTMKTFSISLGVKCNFCHAMDPDTSSGHHLDFASDAKEEKGIARYMMKMTTSLNHDFFNPEHVEKPAPIMMCYTCHRGNKEPGPQAMQTQLDSLMRLQMKH